MEAIIGDIVLHGERFEFPEIAKLIFASTEEVANLKFQKMLKNNESPLHNKLERSRWN